MADLAEVLAGVERVIAVEERFKARLAIGHDIRAVRRAWRSISKGRKVAHAAGTGAGFAKSAVIAGTFFAPAASTNPLVWVGIMAPAAAVTPIGWVIAASLAAGGAYYGVSRWLMSGPDSFVDVIPKFLNTPIDMLGMKLLDLHAGLAFRVAAADGHIDPSERTAIRDHFEQDWGYDPAYLDAALPLIEADRGHAELERLAQALIAFHHSSRDCAPAAMQQELMAFLRDVAAADGIDAPEERDALALLDKAIAGTRALSLKRAARELSDLGATLGDAAGEIGDQARQTAQAGLARAATVLASHRDTPLRILDRWKPRRDG